MGPTDNVATFRLAPGYRKFNLFCKQCNIGANASEEEEATAMPTTISDDEFSDDEMMTNDDIDVEAPTPPPKTTQTSFWSHLTAPFRRKNKKPSENPNQPRSTSFDLDGPSSPAGSPANTADPNNQPHIIPMVQDEEEERPPSSLEQELLDLHHRFNHISFAKLQ